MKKVRAHLIISGRVQGVCFRMETRRAAKRQGNVYGWVKNLPDRTVETILEGNESDVKAMVEWCRKGPPGSLVTDMKLNWESYNGTYDAFEIAY
ncbi:MAG: acylphosphatase [Pseudomonadota bacterium]